MANFDYPWLIEDHDDYAYIKFSPIAVKALGKLVFLDLPDVGAHLKKECQVLELRLKTG